MEYCNCVANRLTFVSIVRICVVLICTCLLIARVLADFIFAILSGSMFWGREQAIGDPLLSPAREDQGLQAPEC